MEENKDKHGSRHEHGDHKCHGLCGHGNGHCCHKPVKIILALIILGAAICVGASFGSHFGRYRSNDDIYGYGRHRSGELRDGAGCGRFIDYRADQTGKIRQGVNIAPIDQLAPNGPSTTESLQ